MTMTRIPLFILAAALAGCGEGGGKQRSISLSIEGAEGRMAYFDQYMNGRPYHVDSVKLDGKGRGVMQVPYLPLDFYRIAVGEEQLVVVLDSTESLTVEARSGQISEPVKAEGSAHTTAMRQFMEETRGFEQKVTALRNALAEDPSNAANVEELNRTNTAYYESCKRFVEEHKGSPLAISVLSRLNIQQEMPLFTAVRDELRRTMPKSGFFQSFREQVDRFEQEQIMMKAQEEEMKRLENMLPMGSVAPDFSQSTPEGGSMALSDLRGKVVLIDFWASWCRPCRIENPNVKRVYQRFQGKGFEILGVSLDRDHESWVKAIKDDGLPWKHVSDLGFWNNAAAQQYGVSSIPYTVLVGRDGTIIGKGLRGPELEAKLAEVLGG